jgi:uncharacterized protein DUF695
MTHKKIYPTESSWSVLQGEHNCKPMFIRRNESATQLKGHPKYDHRVGVATKIIVPNADGLPSIEEMKILNNIEDALSAAFEKKQDSLCVLTVTTNAMREFMFYTRVPTEIEARLNTVRQQFPSRELQFYVQVDSEWDGYAQFT